MAKVIKVGSAINSGENVVIQYLENKDNLPDSFLVLTNIQLTDPKASAEIDAIVFGTPGVYVLEIKDWAGRVAGDNNRPWQHNNRQEENPCRQARRNSQILRGYVRAHAQDVFVDPRVFLGVTFYGLLVLVNPQADTSGVKIQEEEFLRACLKLQDLAPTILKDQPMSKRFVTNSDMRRIAGLLGVPKEQLDTWCPHCFFTKVRAGAKFCNKCGKTLEWH